MGRLPLVLAVSMSLDNNQPNHRRASSSGNAGSNPLNCLADEMKAEFPSFREHLDLVANLKTENIALARDDKAVPGQFTVKRLTNEIQILHQLETDYICLQSSEVDDDTLALLQLETSRHASEYLKILSEYSQVSSYSSASDRQEGYFSTIDFTDLVERTFNSKGTHHLLLKTIKILGNISGIGKVNNVDDLPESRRVQSLESVAQVTLNHSLANYYRVLGYESERECEGEKFTLKSNKLLEAVFSQLLNDRLEFRKNVAAGVDSSVLPFTRHVELWDQVLVNTALTLSEVYLVAGEVLKANLILDKVSSVRKDLSDEMFEEWIEGYSDIAIVHMNQNDGTTSLFLWQDLIFYCSERWPKSYNQTILCISSALTVCEERLGKIKEDEAIVELQQTTWDLTQSFFRRTGSLSDTQKLVYFDQIAQAVSMQLRVSDRESDRLDIAIEGINAARMLLESDVTPDRTVSFCKLLVRAAQVHTDHSPDDYDSEPPTILYLLEASKRLSALSDFKIASLTLDITHCYSDIAGMVMIQEL